MSDQHIIRSVLDFLLLPPLLLMEVRRVQELRGQDGPGGFDPVYHLQEEPLVVVIQKGDGGSSMSQSTSPAHLDGSNKVQIIVTFFISSP